MAGILHGVGMGPGDPDYLTLRALQVLQEPDLLVHFCPAATRANARPLCDQALARDHARDIALSHPYPLPLWPDGNASLLLPC